jgi:O-antigen ligase
VAGVFDLGRPWRLLLFVSAVGFGLLGGFRSEVVMFGLVFGLTFHLEKLWRTRLAVGLCLVGLLLGGLAVGFTRQLPWSVQRSLSVLPLDVEPVARMDAAGSSEWRLEMWRRVWQEVPHYLWKGKGYNLNPHDMGLVEEAMRQGHVSGYELALFAGDYHSGPLSVLMPFGIYGAVAFLMLFGTGGWVLWRNWRHGRGELVNVNRFLLALYGAKIIFFMTVFGSASSDLAGFLGIIGLGVSLNHGVATPPTEVAA